MNRLSIIRTGSGDGGNTTVVGGKLISKGYIGSRLTVGNELALARNHLILAHNALPETIDLFIDFYQDVSWKLGAAISELKDVGGLFAPYQTKLDRAIERVSTMVYPDFVTNDSNSWAQLEIATTHIRNTELGCWDFDLKLAARYLNAFSDYCFMINLLYHQAEPIIAIRDYDTESLGTSQ